MRKYSRLYLAALLAVSLLSACEDPSNVGIGLVGETDTDPHSRTVPVDTFMTANADTAEVSGGSRRFLAGSVNDPLLGTISATGHVDFTPPSGSGSDKFRSGPVTRASLRLRRDYMYGDTTGTQTIRLRTIPATWNPNGLTVDTVFNTGSVVTEFTFTTRDTLIVVPLPAAWVTANDTTLRASDFAAKFHGFQLEAVSGNAVVGFTNRSTFRVVSGGDSLEYVVQPSPTATNLTHTSLSHAGSVNVPQGVVPVQRGLGRLAKISFDVDDPAIQNMAINRFSVVLTPDLSLNSGNTPSGFYRPLLRDLLLYVELQTPGNLPFSTATSSLDRRNRFILSDLDMNIDLQDILKGDQAFKLARIEPIGDFSISVAFIKDLTNPEGKPVAEVTYSPTAL